MDNFNVIDLCDSSEDETSGTAAAFVTGGSTFETAICLDLSSDDESLDTCSTADPQTNQENERAVDIDDVPTRAILERAPVHGPAAGAAPTTIVIIDSDYDSSDDEVDLIRHRHEQMRQEAIQNRTEHRSAPSLSVQQPQDTQLRVDAKRRATTRPSIEQAMRMDQEHSSKNDDPTSISNKEHVKCLAMQRKASSTCPSSKSQPKTTPNAGTSKAIVARPTKQTQVPVRLRQDFLHDIQDTDSSEDPNFLASTDPLSFRASDCASTLDRHSTRRDEHQQARSIRFEKAGEANKREEPTRKDRDRFKSDQMFEPIHLSLCSSESDTLAEEDRPSPSSRNERLRLTATACPTTRPPPSRGSNAHIRSCHREDSVPTWSSQEHEVATNAAFPTLAGDEKRNELSHRAVLLSEESIRLRCELSPMDDSQTTATLLDSSSDIAVMSDSENEKLEHSGRISIEDEGLPTEGTGQRFEGGNESLEIGAFCSAKEESSFTCRHTSASTASRIRLLGQKDTDAGNESVDSHDLSPMVDSQPASSLRESLSDFPAQSTRRSESGELVYFSSNNISTERLPTRTVRKRSKTLLASLEIEASASQAQTNPASQTLRKATQPIKSSGKDDQEVMASVRSNKRMRHASYSETSAESLGTFWRSPSGSENDGEQKSDCMSDVLPSKQFSVMKPDGVLYELKLEVRESKIPNSGSGAFLTFLGARILTRELRNAVLEAKGDVARPIHAQSPSGFGATVKLVGKTVYDYQNLHRSKTSISLSDVDNDVGSLGFDMKRHSIQASDVLLGPNEDIDLGRYGPSFRNERKSQLHYFVKNFIFDNAPAEYGMEVSEEIGGWTQVLDVTDDATGTRHEAALRLPLTYINEVGGIADLKANVLFREKNSRSMHCYFVSSKPLKKGDTVELLTDYGDTYEDMRERKGYGKANTQNGVKSSNHEPTALMRCFRDRQAFILQIDYLSVLELFHLLEFIVESVLEPIENMIDAFLADPKQIHPTRLQWGARIRIHWLGAVFLSRITRLSQELPDFRPYSNDLPFSQLLAQATKWANRMQWPRLGQSFGNLLKRNNDTCAAALRAASREDILHKVSKKIMKPLDESMWCPTSVILINGLCDVTIEATSLKERDRNHHLLKSYLALAKEAAQMINAACRDCEGRLLDMLKFVSSVNMHEVLDSNSLKSFRGFTEADFFHRHTTFRKGILASMIEMQDYLDGIELGFLLDQADVKIIPQSTAHEVLMVHGGTSSKTDMAAHPKHAHSVANSGQPLHEDWYLSWQVAYVVDCFAKEFIVDSKSQYSLGTLCSHIGVDREKAQAAIGLGIETKKYRISFVSIAEKALRKRAQAPMQPRTKRNPRPQLSTTLFDKVIWKTLVELGWTLDVGTRPNDHYFLPNGVERRRGFSKRKDYYDSKLQVMNFIKTDPRWKDLPQVVKAVELFEKLTALKGTSKLPRNVDIDEFITKLK